MESIDANMKQASKHTTYNLVEGVRDSWKPNWHQLVERCGKKLEVLLHVRASTSSVEVKVEDLLQDTWTEAMRCYAQFEYRGQGSFYAWLAGIARNKFRRALRTQRTQFARNRSPAKDCPGDFVAAVDELKAKTVQGFEVAERDEAIREVVTALPEAEREVLLLRIYEGLNGREAAKRLGVHEATVSKRYKAALARCARTLGRG